LIGIAFGALVRTRETVLWETPLASAMSCIVGIRAGRAAAAESRPLPFCGFEPAPFEPAGSVDPASRLAASRRDAVELRFGALAAISLDLLRLWRTRSLPSNAAAT
jgi:hypothetical protein